VRKEFEEEGFVDWSYDDLLEELEKRKLIKLLETQEMTILV
jgi:hypothetical protein